MYRNITEQCRQTINGSSRTFAASFHCGENEYSDIKSLKILVPSALSGKINIGDTISKSVEIVISNSNILLGSEITVFESVRLDSGEYEDIPMGTFTVSKATTKDSVTTIEAEGPLSTDTGFGYFSELVYPATTIQMLNEISVFIGVEIETDGLEEITVSAKPEGYTCREVIGYIAALHGTNAVETRDGTIALKWYEDCEEDIFTNKIDFPELENDLFVIEKFECVQEESSITRGDGFTGISISNPLMTEEIAESVWNKISGFTYRPGTFSIKSGTPCVDPWDSFIYNDERVIGAELEYIHDGGLQNTYKSAGESRTSSASKGPLTQQMDRYYAELVLMKAAMVDTLTVNEADIRYLKADSISAITLVVKEAAIAELSADFVTVESVEANYANITLSNVEKSSIGTLLANVGLITDATIVDGHVTGFLDAVEVNANSVTTGTLSVDRLVFRGSEKSIVYELNNITGALQAVQSETLNGEILTDRSITVDKIVAKSITANEIATATITANELAANCITADKIVSGEITTAKIAVGAITAEKIATASITADKIAANAITAEKIASNSITADKLDVNSIFAQDITATGTINHTDNWGNTSTINMANHSITLATYSNEMYTQVGHYNISSIYPSVVCDAVLVDTGTLITASTIITPGKLRLQGTTYEQYGVKSSGGSYYLNYTSDGILTPHLSVDKIDCYGRMASKSVYTGSVEANTGVFHGAVTASLLNGAFVVSIANGGTGATSIGNFMKTMGLAWQGEWKQSMDVVPGNYSCGAYWVVAVTTDSRYVEGTHAFPNNYYYLFIFPSSNGVQFAVEYNTGRIKSRCYVNNVWQSWTIATPISEGGTGATTAAGAHQNLHGNHFPTPVYIDCMGGNGHNGGGGYCTINELKSALGYMYYANKLSPGSGYPYLLLNSSGNLKPYSSDGANLDNTITIGTSSARFKSIFAATGTVSSSDRNLKDNIKGLTEVHKQFLMKLIPVSFTFKDGESGRTHIGFISQDVEQAMTECGMTDLDFAGFCKDVKTTVQYSDKIVLDKDGKAIFDEVGKPMIEKIEKEVPLLDEAGNKQYIYSLRYEEFIGLITYVLQDTVNKLDIMNILQQNILSRMAILEARLTNMAA